MVTLCEILVDALTGSFASFLNFSKESFIKYMRKYSFESVIALSAIRKQIHSRRCCGSESYSSASMHCVSMDMMLKGRL